MKKRIYKSMLLLALITILLTSFLITAVIYGEFYNRMQQEIRNEALFLSTGFNQIGLDFFTMLEDETNTSRITWIASDGKVLYDNRVDAQRMENHSDRPEIAAALKNGFGESAHLSNTLGTQTFYRALRLQDGTVLRVSTTTYSVFISVLDIVPYIALITLPVILLTILIAHLLAKQILVPLNNLNLENPLSNEVYDELSPLLARMAKQNMRIDSQIKKMKEKQEEFIAITENNREGIIILNSKGQVLSINKSAASIFSVSVKGKMNKHILTLNRSITLQEAVKSALSGYSYEDTFTQDNKTYHILASPVRESRSIKGAVLFILDITEKESAEKMRREFSANVSHELKTPLTSISGYAELMKSGMVKPDDIAVFSGRIFNEARHLINLVEDIIQISKLDEKNVSIPFEDIDLFALAQEVVDRLSHTALQKKVKLSLSGQTAIVSGVRQMLEEVIYNLCDNAIKYNYENGTVDVNISQSSENIMLIVTDSGFGIPIEQQSRVFERFYRVDKSHSKDTGGTGLGLSIVKHSVEYHNARIVLSSKPGQGTRVSVTFNKEIH